MVLVTFSYIITIFKLGPLFTAIENLKEHGSNNTWFPRGRAESKLELDNPEARSILMTGLTCPKYKN